jgi:hypothetical protein
MGLEGSLGEVLELSVRLPPCCRLPVAYTVFPLPPSRAPRHRLPDAAVLGCMSPMCSGLAMHHSLIGRGGLARPFVRPRGHGEVGATQLTTGRW